MSQLEAGNQISTSVAKLGLDMAEQTGEAVDTMMKSMELSVSPNLGSQIDISL